VPFDLMEAAMKPWFPDIDPGILAGGLTVAAGVMALLNDNRAISDYIA
jgi:hypothetical protein